jgi:LPXTG-motif cell wall-anchored protein
MPTGLGGGVSDTGSGVTITYAFAGLVLLALAGLIVLRHLTGTISISR